ncbi:MAG: hypothetical protein DRR42_22540 [Gammaproteobacteria bacterium]|nr:MAG: hypothetical protein DRR42_22540 [Gammaproteobacteria bacterium]
MNLSQALGKCWHDIEIEYSRGYTNNPSTFAFAFLKSFSAHQPDLEYSYDGRVFESETYSPSLVVWQDYEKPQVLFIGKFSFHPPPKSLFQKKLDFLKASICAPTVGVLLNEFVAGNHRSTPMPVSAHCDFGYFVIGNKSTIERDHLAAIESLSSEEKSRFHYAYATIPLEQNGDPVFDYIAPTSWM